MKCHPDILLAYCDALSGVAVVVLDTKGLITSCNQAFLRLLSAAADQDKHISGQPLERWLTLDGSSDWLCFEPADTLGTRLFSARLVSDIAGVPYTGVAIRYQSEQAFFIQRDLQQDVDVLDKITGLNMEISTLARDLSRKNNELSRANKQISLLMDTDPLTGIYNRRYLMPRLEEMVSYARRTATFVFSLLMLDIDHFKKVNDTYGHAAGDAVLRTLTLLLGKNLRREDILARFGGEEFLVLLPGQTAAQAKLVAEKLRSLVAHADMPHGHPVTISSGVTAWSRKDTAETLLSRADNALYAAKAAGRNRVAEA